MSNSFLTSSGTVLLARGVISDTSSSTVMDSPLLATNSVVEAGEEGGASGVYTRTVVSGGLARLP